MCGGPFTFATHSVTCGSTTKARTENSLGEEPWACPMPGLYLSASDFFEGTLSVTRNQHRVLKQFTGHFFFFQNGNRFIGFHGNDTYFYNLEYVLRMSVKVLALLLAHISRHM